MNIIIKRICAAVLALSLSLSLAVNTYAEEIAKVHKQETVSAEQIHTELKKPEKTPITKDALPEALDFDRVKEQGLYFPT